MPFEAVLFDLDGTLLDTHEDLADSLNAVLADIGKPPLPSELVKRYIGGGVELLVQRALGPDHDPDLVPRCVAKFREEYGRRWADKTHPYDGIEALIAALVRQGLRVAVYSNKPDVFTRDCVAKFLPAIPSDAVLGAQPSIPKKPDPAGAWLMAEKLGVEPKNVLYLGDSDTDMQTATAAGMYAVGATWGYRSVEEIQSNGAAATIDHPLDLLKLLDESCMIKA
jgi:phosphoglycolate phosphatase